MAKLTRKQRAALDHILAYAKRGQAYLMKDDHAICMRRRVATMTIDYVRQDGNGVLCEVDKHIGSEIALLHTAIRDLQQFLEREST